MMTGMGIAGSIGSLKGNSLNIALICGRKTISILHVCLLFLLFVGQQVFASEQYFLDGHQTLLYKSINWWYYAPEKDAENICGHAVRYSYQGNVRHSYDEPSMVLAVYPEDGFADLLSVLSPDKDLHRLVTLRGNKGDVLSDNAGTPMLTIEEHSLSNKYIFSFNSISRAEYQQLIKDIKSWQFVLKSKIWGLRNGKLALYRASDNLRNCSNNKRTKNNQARFMLCIYRRVDNGVVAEFILEERYALKREKRSNENRP
jgi:hypothetical protein